MAIVIGSMKAVDCGIGISTSSTGNLQVDSLETTRCGMGMHIRDDINNTDLECLLNKIDDLEASSISERALLEEAIALIQAQIASPSSVKEFLVSLRAISEGAAGSMLYTVVSSFAQA